MLENQVYGKEKGGHFHFKFYSIIIIMYRPIHDAIEAGNITIVRLLVEHGANLMAEQGGKTPVDLARSLGHSDIASYLDGKFLSVNVHCLTFI